MIVREVFTKRQAMVSYTIGELVEMFNNEQITLREINKLQVRMIRRYILSNALKEQVYLPPIVARVEDGRSLDEGKPANLVIIDGTQRLKALMELQTYVEKAISSDDDQARLEGLELIGGLEKIEVAFQIFEGLDAGEADQLYIDLNTKSKKVALSKRISFDSRNEINQATNKVLQRNDLLKKAGVELEKRAVMRPKNKNLLSLSQLRQIIAYFITGKRISSNLAYEAEMNLLNDDPIEIIDVWFDELFKLYPVKRIGNYEVSMLASFPLLYAVAVYAVVDTGDMNFEEKKEVVIARMRKLEKVDWARTNTVWREFNGSVRGREKYYYLNNDKKTIDALTSWLQRQGGE